MAWGPKRPLPADRTRRRVQALKKTFVLERRGMVTVKGKGDLRTYFLVSERGAPAASGGTGASLANPAPAEGAVDLEPTASSLAVFPV